MRATGYFIVAIVFVAVALATYGIILAIDSKIHDLVLVVSAGVASQVGAIVWHRQSPGSLELTVKLGLGLVQSFTAVAFGLLLQGFTGWFEYPEVSIPMSAVGCFVMPFAVVGTAWKALTKSVSSERMDSGSDT